MKIRSLILASLQASFLLATTLCAAQSFPAPGGTPQPANSSAVTLPLVNPPSAPTSGSVSRTGNPGNATYYYWVVSEFLAGNSSPAGPFIAAQAPSVLSAANYETITWSSVQNALSYDVLRTSSPSPPSGACTCALVIGTSNVAVVDNGGSLLAYTVNTLDPNSLQMVLDNEAASFGSSRPVARQGSTLQTLILGNPNGIPNVLANFVNPTQLIPGSGLIVSGGTAQTTTIADANSTTSVLDVASPIDFKVNEGLCVTAAGSVATIHCGPPAASATSDCISQITGINGTKISISPPCNSAPASGATLYHDETLALRAAINLCNGSTTQAFVMPSGIFYANGAPVAVNGSNFILPLPTIGTPQGTKLFINAPVAVCEFIGETRPALSLAGNPVPNIGPQIITANTATNYSLIGGRGTGAAGCGGTCSNFTFIDLESTNMRWIAPANAGNAIGCGYVARCNVRRSIIDTYGVPLSVPTNGVAFIMPYVGNANQSTLSDSEIYGFNVGVQCFDHSYIENDRFGYLNAWIQVATDAAGIDSGGSTPSGHMCEGKGDNAEAVVNGIAPGVDPVQLTTVGGEFDLFLDLEHDAGTFAAVQDINDSANLLRGNLTYIIRPPLDTKSPATLLLNGGKFINRCSPQDGWCSQGINIAGLQWQAGATVLGSGNPGAQAKQITITQDGQGFVFMAPPGLTWSVVTENGFTSTSVPNFTGHSITACPTSSLLAADNADITGWWMAKDTNNWIAIYIYNGKIYFVKNVAGALTVLNGAGAGEAYPGAAGTFTCVQLAESSGAFTMKTSTSFGGTLNADSTCAATCVSWSYTSGVNIVFGIQGVSGNTSPALPGGVKFDPIQIQ